MAQAEALLRARLLAFFPDSGTMDDARTEVQRLVGAEILTTSETRTESFFMGLPDTTEVINVLQSNATAIVKKNVAASWQTKCLRLMAPRVLSYYMMSKKFVFSCCEEIMKPNYNAIVALARDSNQAECTIEQLGIYTQAVDDFRSRLADIMAAPEFNNISGTMAGVYNVEQDNLASIATILQEIKTQRRIQLTNNVVRRDALALPSHAISFEGFFDGVMEIPAARLNKVNLDGIRLVATAMVDYLNNRVMTLAAYERSSPGVIALIPDWPQVRAQVVSILDNPNAAGGARRNNDSLYSQQIANIDTPFLTYLWFRISGVIEMQGTEPTSASLGALLKMNATLYGMGSKISGMNVLIRDYFTGVTGPLATMAGLMNTTGSIHQPPYAMNYHRLSHLIASFGGIYLPNVRRSIYTMGVSALYITSLKLESGAGARFIIAWNNIQKLIAPYYPNQNAAVQANANALHALHQLFLRKPTCMARSLGLGGRLDEVILHGVVGDDRTIQIAMADIVVFAPDLATRRAAGVLLNNEEAERRRAQIRNIIAGVQVVAPAAEAP